MDMSSLSYFGENSMHRILLAVGLIAFVATTAMAQPGMRVIDSLGIRTDDQRDPILQRHLVFGFGATYSDGVDTANGAGEFFFPFPGSPSGFYATLQGKDFQGDDGFGYEDVRGIPDSVMAGRDRFELTFIVKLQQGFGTPIVSISQPIAAGLDSVNIQSTQPGANFFYTFGRNGGEVKLNHKEITTLKMTAYFNNHPSAVPIAHNDVTRGGMTIAPNPVRGNGRIDLRGRMPAGSRVMVYDMSGTVVHSLRMNAAADDVSLALPALPAGLYGVRIIGADGVASSGGSFVVME
ncbi:MAG: hypothetical protein JWQ98_3146 [Chlorobi bacterium]|nr:hypothetical protein [Chlorobiota bacterium]